MVYRVPHKISGERAMIDAQPCEDASQIDDR
jgi:hypothetical protein